MSIAAAALPSPPLSLRRTLCVWLLLAAIASGTAQAQPQRSLSITVWAVDLNPQQQLSDQQLMDELRERARSGLSAMLYGYHFDYTLENRPRQIAARFRLEPVAEIAIGDPHLQLRDSWRDGELLYAQFTYRAERARAAWLDAWQSASVATASAIGEEAVWASSDEQNAAITRAVQQSITDHLRATRRNKPQRAHGTLLFRHGPKTWIDSGAYWARVSIYLRIDAVDELGVY